MTAVTYYWMDLAVAAAVPLLILVLRLSGKAGPRLVRQFWLGAAVGLTWEVPIFVGSCATEAYRTIAYITPLPLHWSVFLAAHTSWDGGLFVLGCLLVRGLFGAGAMRSWDWRQLSVFIAYGQVQALAVELSSVMSSGWYYLDLAWNPAVMTVNGHNVSLLQQEFWLVGSVLFYVIWLRLEARQGPA